MINISDLADHLVEHAEYAFEHKDREELERVLKEFFYNTNNGWIPFKTKYDKELKMDILQGKTPDEDEEIILTNGIAVWFDTFLSDGKEFYLDTGVDLTDTSIAWQPLPEPYREAIK